MTTDTLEIFQGNNQLWYWRLVAANNEIIAQSQAYRRKWNAKRAGRRIAPHATIHTIR